jgi:hypothetical protein
LYFGFCRSRKDRRHRYGPTAIIDPLIRIRGLIKYVSVSVSVHEPGRQANRSGV